MENYEQPFKTATARYQAAERDLAEASRLLEAANLLIRNMEIVGDQMATELDRVTAERDKLQVDRDEAVKLLGEMAGDFDDINIPSGIDEHETICKFCGKPICEGDTRCPPNHCTNPDCPAVKARALIERLGGDES